MSPIPIWQGCVTLAVQFRTEEGGREGAYFSAVFSSRSIFAWTTDSSWSQTTETGRLGVIRTYATRGEKDGAP